jgi:hypothetical protein
MNWRVLSPVKINTRISETPCIFLIILDIAEFYQAQSFIHGCDYVWNRLRLAKMV